MKNISCKPFRFSFAFHSYLSVSDISEVQVEGLETMDYLNNFNNKERFTEQGAAITFEAEFDRVYLGSPNIVVVLDHERKRTYVIRREGLSYVAFDQAKQQVLGRLCELKTTIDVGLFDRGNSMETIGKQYEQSSDVASRAASLSDIMYISYTTFCLNIADQEVFAYKYKHFGAVKALRDNPDLMRSASGDTLYG
ncbi:putative glucose-6-phosphate 1-epimerase [Tanacetum coccineum]